MRAAFQQVPKARDEFDFDLRAWAEILVDEIPEANLDTVYYRAMTKHESLFPLSVTEMLLAYREMLVEAAVEARKRVCSHCDAHEADPVTYPACPFHGPGSRNPKSISMYVEPKWGPTLPINDGVLPIED